MDPSTLPRARKRRAVNACATCRNSKVKCDGERPCQRCTRNQARCEYYDTVKDPTVLRIEALEAEVVAVKAGLENFRGQSIGSVSIPSPQTSVSAPSLVTARSAPTAAACTSARVTATTAAASENAVQKGLITIDQASFWFRSFFSGSVCTNLDSHQQR
ncbi:hypothetical protein EJ04DRAFT_273524 [Polyplosphaeria fusca]|uniref:Zn(2)-C6 fungal-type domain-containing protein n=1 Tax=Polyplosphaeria fusca TaxID=682080 RepID=A0A9P4QY81_9PLEO|nr:hypothetical protein EJ04DRAFT_273524 [Polyplosphaeria fusca]